MGYLKYQILNKMWSLLLISKNVYFILSKTHRLKTHLQFNINSSPNKANSSTAVSVLKLTK